MLGPRNLSVLAFLALLPFLPRVTISPCALPPRTDVTLARDISVLYVRVKAAQSKFTSQNQLSWRVGGGVSTTHTPDTTNPLTS
jgi:hypothetical protein